MKAAVRGRIRDLSAAIAALLLIGTGGAAAGAAGQAGAETVRVLLDEWHVQPEKTVVKAGPVEFRAANRGKEDHELVIVKTNLAEGDLPTDDGKVREDDAGELIGEIEEFPPGETRRATFRLAPGDYVLFCNIVEQEEDGETESHYREGMRTTIRVVE